MLQIFVIVSPSVLDLICGEELVAFEESVVKVTKEIFEIGEENNVAFRRMEAKRTANAADIQIQIYYTAGRDKCGRDEIFDLSEEKRDELADAILRLAQLEFGGEITVSARIEMLRDLIFKTM